jgi:hypothetical protein
MIERRMENIRRTVLSLLFVGIAAVIVASAGFAFAQNDQPLTNERLIELSKSGASEDILIKAVEIGSDTLDMSVEGLLALKNGGVRQKVISAALAAKSKKAEAKTAAENALIPDEVGVYAVVEGKLKPVEPEILSLREGGNTKSAFGLSGGHTNAIVNAPQSLLQLSGDLVFVLHCLEGISASEYQLLPLAVKSDHREFRALSKNMWGVTGTGVKNAISFKFETIAPRTYKIALKKLKRGEYAFLPPGQVNKSTDKPAGAEAGKIYSFGVKE